MLMLIEVVLLIIVVTIAAYLKEKGKNLATKEDIRKITDEVESIKTYYAAQLHVSQVRYENEFKILSELAERLIETRDSALSLRPVIDFVPVDKDVEDKKRLMRFYDSMRNLYRYLETKRAFYPAYRIPDAVRQGGIRCFR